MGLFDILKLPDAPNFPGFLSVPKLTLPSTIPIPRVPKLGVELSVGGLGSSGSTGTAISDISNLFGTTCENIFVNDSFVNWLALNAKDFNKSYGYEFAIVVGDTVHEKFTFPMNPQSISISVPNTTQTTVTMKGIVEEHNGAPLRQIRISGTTGVLTGEGGTEKAEVSGSITAELLSIGGTIFGDAIQAGKNVISKVGGVVKAVGGNVPTTEGPLNYTDNSLFNAPGQESDPNPEIRSGYHFAHSLARYLD